MTCAFTWRLLEKEAKQTSYKMVKLFFFSRLQEANFWWLGENKGGFTRCFIPP